MTLEMKLKKLLATNFVSVNEAMYSLNKFLEDVEKFGQSRRNFLHLRAIGTRIYE